MYEDRSCQFCGEYLSMGHEGHERCESERRQVLLHDARRTTRRVIDRHPMANGDVRIYLDNGWFVDRMTSKRMSWFGTTYACFAPGESAGRSALPILGDDKLKSLLADLGKPAPQQVLMDLDVTGSAGTSGPVR